ncbi:MAG TPA: HAD-IB family phosphatase [Candidatus Angelobacter sp.]|nr:HAD-IB family phosphatase [Candidatus Angelobacter sp.]
MGEKEVMEVKEVDEVKEKDVGVAAFFDLDGTLVPLPSFEKRLFQTLRHRREIPLRNYLLWLAEALRLLPRGFRAVAHANKMYLKGVSNLHESDAENGEDFSARKSGPPSELPSLLRVNEGTQAGGQASATPPKRARRNPRCPVPRFLEAALERVAWHASCGHDLVIVSGTLEPLANAAARELEAELAARGFVAEIRVRATRLEAIENRWTGKILGEAMFGEAKARAVKKLAEQLQLDLARSHAYGDSFNDEAMLDAVGNSAAVNPSAKLTRIAKRRGWALLVWNKEKELTQRTQSSQRAQRSKRKSNDTPMEKSALRRAGRCA